MQSLCARDCSAFNSRDILQRSGSDDRIAKTLLSVYSNFGEGFERDGNREFAQFVAIAKGSIGETRAQLIYALDFGYLEPEIFSELDQLGKAATKCLGGLIHYLSTQPFEGESLDNEKIDLTSLKR
jgi:four helix bundle protein